MVSPPFPYQPSLRLIRGSQIDQHLHRIRPDLDQGAKITMPTLLTIPTEIRLRILNHAISDLKGSGCSISANGLSGVLKNPNVNVHLICRQIRHDCMSPQVRRPRLEVSSEGLPDGWRFLEFRTTDGRRFRRRDCFVKMMTQISALVFVYDGEYFYQEWAGGSLNIEQWNFHDHIAIHLRNDIRCRHLGYGDKYEVGIKIERDEKAKSATITTTVTLT